MPNLVAGASDVNLDGAARALPTGEHVRPSYLTI